MHPNLHPFPFTTEQNHFALLKQVIFQEPIVNVLTWRLCHHFTTLVTVTENITLILKYATYCHSGCVTFDFEELET
jgi:hypothetical protein